MKAEFVVDASVIAAWLLQDEQDSYAIDVAEHLGTGVIFAPLFFMIEIGNVLLSAQRRGRINTAQATECLERLVDLEFQLEPMGNTATLPGLMNLAHEHGLSLYDAIYLELALRRRLPLATLDKQLLKAAKKCGIGIFKP